MRITILDPVIFRSVPDNDQVHRAGGPTRVNVEKPKTLNEGEDVEKPKDERAPVKRPVMRLVGRVVKEPFGRFLSVFVVHLP